MENLTLEKGQLCDICDEWNVYFGYGFGEADGYAKADEKITVDREFEWEEEHWLIPAVYLCGEGLVTDLCLRIPQAKIWDFIHKWDLSFDSAYTDFDHETQMQIDAENPLCADFNLQACLNGSIITQSAFSSVTWNPCLPDEVRAGMMDAHRALGQYHLDPAYGWAFYRVSFPWAAKQRLKIETLTLSMVRDPIEILGPDFHVAGAGDAFGFIHPISGTEHILTVQEYGQQKMEDRGVGLGNYDYPKHNMAMWYTLSPDLSEERFFVRDCAVSDRPAEFAWGGGTQLKVHAACSAMHFEPEKDVTWRVVFREKMKKDITLSVLP